MKSSHVFASATVALGIIACSTGHVAKPQANEVDLGGVSASLCAPDAPEVTADAIKKCLGTGLEAAKCMQPIWSVYLKTHTTKQALAALQCMADADQTLASQCHPISHSIGRETFAIHQSVDLSFRECDQTCIAGCYHGVMERFLRGDDGNGDHISLAEVKSKVATACDPNLPGAERFQCLHGLGHGVEFFTGYKLLLSLDICEAATSDWDRHCCYGGVFMENIVGVPANVRDLKDDDPDYPCDIVDDHYRAECWMIQTSRMKELGLDPPHIITECGKAGSYRATCMGSLGRDSSPLAISDGPRACSSICELGVPEDRDACTEGAVKSLADVTWDGKYALPLCPSYSTPDAVTHCFDTAADYLTANFQRDLRAECAKWLPGDARCTAPLDR